MIIWVFKPSIARIFFIYSKDTLLRQSLGMLMNWTDCAIVLHNGVIEWWRKKTERKKRRETERKRYSMHWIMCSWWAVNHFKWMISSHIQKNNNQGDNSGAMKMCVCVLVGVHVKERKGISYDGLQYLIPFLCRLCFQMNTSLNVIFRLAEIRYLLSSKFISREFDSDAAK